jgi:hypothetical protein
MGPPALHDLPEPEGAVRPAAPPSVLRALNAVQRRLEDAARHGAHGDPADLRATARDLLHAIDLSADVALACVLRNQVAGSYAMRHSVETAVIAALVARHLHMRPIHLLSTVSAALALHATGRHDEPKHDGPVTRAVRCTRDTETDWFACLLSDHAPEEHAPPDPLAVELLRMADRYCAGVSPRNYRRALLPADALARALHGASHPELAAAFTQEIGPCPPGTVVRLAGGEVAVVTHRDGGQPEVLCLRDDAGRRFTVPLPRRVGEDDCAIASALGEEDHDIHIGMKQVWGPLASL